MGGVWKPAFAEDRNNTRARNRGEKNHSAGLVGGGTCSENNDRLVMKTTIGFY